MDSKKLSFAIDASTIDIKPLLKKDFLELSMRAISSANPNRNKSWFTRESMEKSLHTFHNKPILGYFENGDFVSHNGDWNHDDETQMDYWDTLGRRGERMLGLIRESDEVKIVTGKDGLDWIELRCALWVQYSFKQVKRLIKDAKRAQKEGGLAKNVSVEVDITDYEMLDNGIMMIKEFNLVGITILGSRNGVKVEPGIEDAGLSVLEIMGRDVFAKQESALRLAYAKLDDSVNNKKEEFSMDNEQNVQSVEETVEKNDQNIDTIESTEENIAQFEENSTESVESNEVIANEETHFAEGENVCQDCVTTEEQSITEETNNCNEVNDCNEEAQCEENVQPEEECGQCEENQNAEDTENDTTENCECNKFEAQCKELEVQLEEINAKYAAMESQYNELVAKLESMSDYEENKRQLNEYRHQEFLNQAYALINSAKLNDAITSDLYKACECGEVESLSDLKVKVALKVFEVSTQNEEPMQSLNTPVSTPDTTSVFAKDSTKKASKVNDPWSSLHEYVGK